MATEPCFIKEDLSIFSLFNFFNVSSFNSKATEREEDFSSRGGHRSQSFGKGRIYSFFLNYSINFFGLLQGQILKKECKYGHATEKSSWSGHT
jgi:hypothetical protein